MLLTKLLSRTMLATTVMGMDIFSKMATKLITYLMEIWVFYRSLALYCLLSDTPPYVKPPMMAGLVMCAMKTVAPVQMELINVTPESSEVILELLTIKENGAHHDTGTKRIAKD